MNEKIEDIICELRNNSTGKIRYRDGSGITVKDLADRIEKAWKRDGKVCVK